jgi:N-methylhydantoinase A
MTVTGAMPGAEARPPEPRWLRVGVDVGGTFTDLVMADLRRGTTFAVKVPTSTENPAVAILQSIAVLISRAGARADRVASFAHGTTVATNALLEGSGSTPALITTAGFEDLLAIRRQTRPELYDLRAVHPSPLVPERLRRGVRERLDGSSVLTALSEQEVAAAVTWLGGTGAVCVAICFLHSYRDGTHEEMVEESVRAAFPAMFVSSSHSLLPKIREYERLSTTVVNAYLGPVMDRYLNELATGLAGQGIAARPLLNQSSGGVMTFEEAAAAPVRTVLSGPSSGVMAARWTAQRLGVESVLTLDMGGTSTDVARLDHGVPGWSRSREIGGFSVAGRALEIHTIGAGGGSLARIDEGGALQVGPASAGAWPGPALYGRGGDQMTVTDANAILGRLSATELLGGEMKLDLGAAENAAATLAAGLGVAAEDAAAAVVSLVNAKMAAALRLVSIARGYDPRDYSLLAYGGAGPLHGAELADELGITEVIVPQHPGLQCALGLLIEDVRVDLERTVLAPLDEAALPLLDRAYAELEGRAADWLDREGVPGQGREVQRWAEVRYRAQNHELVIPVAAPLSVAAIRAGFEDAHRRERGYAPDGEDIEVVTVVVTGIAAPEGGASVPPYERGAARAGAADAATRPVHFAGLAAVPSRVIDRAVLRPGDHYPGPLVIEELDSTTLVPPGWTLTVAATGDLLLRRIPGDV